MNKKKIYVVLFLLIMCLLQYWTYGGMKLHTEVVDNVIIFLSIVFGFYITSLAIFVTSKYVSDLYKTIDNKNPSLTLLHTLMKRFKFGLDLILITVLYLLLINFFIKQTLSNELLLSNYYILPFSGIVLLNFIYGYILLNDLVNIIIQEAKNKA
ncbi:MAG: hypothetical protein KW788_01260 [Candidatus Doudnabacteria bacterium]|nr:hypothetical protein [Candidatus Doudnabacteria bacterium]